jgi:Zn-dependent alcohol dehydrogenase
MSRFTRRKLLGKGMTVAAAGATALLAGPQATGLPSQSPAVITRQRFRAWISRGDGRGRTTLQDVTLRPISGRQVVVRTEITNLCYSNATAVLGQPNAPAATAAPPSVLAAPNGARRMNDMAVIQGHGGVGIVEAVGPEVRRVKGGRSRVRLRHASMRILLSMFEGPVRHVSVSQRHWRR